MTGDVSFLISYVGAGVNVVGEELGAPLKVGTKLIDGLIDGWMDCVG